MAWISAYNVQAGVGCRYPCVHSLSRACLQEPEEGVLLDEPERMQLISGNLEAGEQFAALEPILQEAQVCLGHVCALRNCGVPRSMRTGRCSIIRV